MMQKIRNLVQGWVATLLIILVTAGFVLWGVQYYIEQKGNSQKVVAKVNGQNISDKELNTVYQQMQKNQQASSSGVLPNEEMQRQLKQTALRNIILNTALLQSAIKAGFRVGPDQVKQLIVNAPQFQVDGRFSEQRFNELLYANSTTPQDFMKMLQSTLVTDQMAVGISQTEFVLPNDVKQSYELLKEKRNFGYFLVPAKQFFNDVKVTSQDIQNYYKQHQNDFIEPEKVSVSYIILSPKEISQAVSVTEPEIKQYYQENKDHYPKSKSWKDAVSSIKSLLMQQKTDQIFSKKSEELSNITFTSPTTLEPAAKSLNLTINKSPLITREGEKSGLFANPKVMAAVFSDDVLQQKNNSNMIELKDGSLMVLRVNQYQPSRVKDIALVRDKIKMILTQQMASRKAGVVAYQVQSALSSGSSPQSLASRYNLKWLNKTNITRADKSTPQPVLKAAFNLLLSVDKKPAINSVLVDNGDYAVIQLFDTKLGNFALASSEETNVLKDNLANFLGQLDYRLYVSGVMNRAKVKLKP